MSIQDEIESIKAEKERIAKQRKRNKRIIIIIGLLMFMILPILYGISIVKTKTNARADAPQGSQVADVGWETGDQRDSVTKEKLAQMQMDMVWDYNPIAVLDETTRQNGFAFKNNEENKYPIFIRVYDKDTKEIIFETKLIKVGEEIFSKEVKVKIPKGEKVYGASQFFVNPDTKEIIGESQSEIKVINNR